MSQRESELHRLGVQLGFTVGSDGHIRESIGPEALDLAIPSLSAYGEFTPISVLSYTVTVTEHADVERDKC